MVSAVFVLEKKREKKNKTLKSTFQLASVKMTIKVCVEGAGRGQTVWMSECFFPSFIVVVVVVVVVVVDVVYVDKGIQCTL